MSTRSCPGCGDELNDSVLGGLCPSCLLRSAVSRQPLPEFDGYVVEAELGRGGMGVVYLARDLAVGTSVALKVIRSGEFASPAERLRFADDALIASQLSHPNIIRILDASQLMDEEPFFTMELFEAGSLGDHGARQRFGTPRDAVGLMIIIANAVHHLHLHGVLHRDLKPANILLRADGEPVVSDFGAAKLLDRDHGTQTGAIVGTLLYMAPEQLAGEPATVLSDVYSLGAMLYDLLTGHPPFRGDDLPELTKQIAHDEPVPPGQLATGISLDLETVCLCALAKEPSRRYQSAAAFSDDLARALSHEPVLARRATRTQQLWRFMRRHPVTAAIGVGSALFAVFALATSVFVVVMQAQELRRFALDMNAYAASAQASNVLYALREHAHALEAGARDPRVQQLAANPSPNHVAPELEAHASRFGSLLIVAMDGRKWARWPTPSDAWFQRPPTLERDYRRGAQRFALRGEQQTYVAKSFRSSVDHNSLFALSTPIFDAARQPLGLLVATIAASSTGAPIQIRAGRDDRPTTVLLGPDEGSTGTSVSAAPGSGEFTFLVHPGLARGEHRRLASNLAHAIGTAFASSVAPDAQFVMSRAVPMTIDDYADPLFGGRWLAAFAPVGGTGYVVLVQSRDGVVLRPVVKLVKRFAVGFCCGIGFVLIVLVVLLRGTRVATRSLTRVGGSDQTRGAVLEGMRRP